MRIIVAGPNEDALMRGAYPALTAAGIEVLAVVDTVQQLVDVTSLGRADVVLVQADLAPTVQEAVACLGNLAELGLAQLAVVLPARWSGQREAFAELELVAGFTAPVNWPQVARTLKERARIPKERVGQAEEAPIPSAPLQRAAAEDAAPEGIEDRAQASRAPESADRPLPRPARRPAQPAGRRSVALWSGPAGGTGRTTLALALGVLAAEWGAKVGVAALAEPAASVYLGLSRMPNAVDVLAEGRTLAQAEQTVTWPGADGRPLALRLLLGPGRPREGAVEREQIGKLVEAFRRAHPLAIVDLPVLAPGGNAWALEPLAHVSDVVLVTPPTARGVAAAVEALATLRELKLAPRLHLALNRRLAGGLSAGQVVESVTQTWGTCPPLAGEVVFLPQLPARVGRGELPDLVVGQTPLAQGLGDLAEAACGLSRPVVEEDEEGAMPPDRGERAAERRRRRGLGRLISVEVT